MEQEQISSHQEDIIIQPKKKYTAFAVAAGVLLLFGVIYAYTYQSNKKNMKPVENNQQTQNQESNTVAQSNKVTEQEKQAVLQAYKDIASILKNTEYKRYMDYQEVFASAGYEMTPQIQEFKVDQKAAEKYMKSMYDTLFRPIEEKEVVDIVASFEKGTYEDGSMYIELTFPGEDRSDPKTVWQDRFVHSFDLIAGKWYWVESSIKGGAAQ